MDHPLARGWHRVFHSFVFLGLVFSMLSAGQPPAARAQAVVRENAASAATQPQGATITLDGVEVAVQTSALPSGAFTVAEPGSASQVATSASWKPFRELAITAVPFGTRAGTESLPAAESGTVDGYQVALRSYRAGQGAEVSDGPVATFFGQQSTAVHSLVSLNVDGPEMKAVAIDEWVVQAGNRLWIVRASQEQTNGALGAQTVSAADGLSLTSTTLDRPSTVTEDLSGSAAANPAESVGAATLPTPSWWHGDCDTITYSAGSGGRAAYRLGKVYLGMPACGPRPWSDHAPDVLVHFFSGSWGELEWECVELSMRFLYLMYGIHPYGANGSTLVWNYSGTRLDKITNHTVGRAPQPNDVLSYGATSTAGHTAVVTSSTVDVNGNGTIDVIEQNSAASGGSTLTVTNWTVAGNAGTISGWLHDATNDPTPTPTATPTVTPTPAGTPTPTPTPGADPDLLFADDFERADGPVGNDWAPWSNETFDPSADLLNGELRTYGDSSVGGGASRSLPVAFPLAFSFDFHTDNSLNECGATQYNDGGWMLSFNAADSATPSSSAAQVKLGQYAGSRDLLRRYITSPGTVDQSGMAADMAPIVPGQRDFGQATAHLEGTVFADLSAVIKINYNDGLSPDPILLSLGPAAGAIDYQPGQLLMLANSNCSSGPHYFDNLQLGAYPTHVISGNAGAAGVRLNYFDMVAKTATADGTGNYAFAVSDGWSGTVTPSLTGAAFTPANRSYTGLTVDQTGQNYQTLFTTTFRSTGSQDGWLLESSETSEQGGTANSTGTTLRVGDEVTDSQYRAVLSFNTASLPDTAVITQVTLKLMKQGRMGTSPFASQGNLLADIRKGAFSNNSAVQIGDFQASANLNAALTFTNSLVNGWYSQPLAPANFGYVYKTGLTQFRLRFTLDDNDDLGADYLLFYSGNATSAYRPQLIIQYYVP